MLTQSEQVNMRLDVRFIHRARGRFHSIEELFASVTESLPNWIRWSIKTAPSCRANLAGVFENLCWIRTIPKSDLVHLTGDIHYAILAIWKTPVVLTIHDLRFFEESRAIRRMLFWIFWLYLPCLRASRVTVISEFTKERLLAAVPVNSNKVRVIPNCVSNQFYPLPREWPKHNPRLLLVGTTDNKNLQRVMTACIGIDLHLCILGKLSDGQSNFLQCNKISFENHVSLSRDGVIALYQSCDLLVFVSTYEGFGLPILEAQAVGRPVITSNMSPMREISGQGALLVDPMDITAIRDGITKILSDAGLRETLIQSGLSNAERYSPKSIAVQYATLYRELIPE